MEKKSEKGKRESRGEAAVYFYKVDREGLAGKASLRRWQLSRELKGGKKQV